MQVFIVLFFVIERISPFYYLIIRRRFVHTCLIIATIVLIRHENYDAFILPRGATMLQEIEFENILKQLLFHPKCVTVFNTMAVMDLF